MNGVVCSESFVFFSKTIWSFLWVNDSWVFVWFHGGPNDFLSVFNFNVCSLITCKEKTLVNWMLVKKNHIFLECFKEDTCKCNVGAQKHLHHLQGLWGANPCDMSVSLKINSFSWTLLRTQRLWIHCWFRVEPHFFPNVWNEQTFVNWFVVWKPLHFLKMFVSSKPFWLYCCWYWPLIISNIVKIYF